MNMKPAFGFLVPAFVLSVCFVLACCIPGHAELVVYWADQDGADVVRAETVDGAPEMLVAGLPGALGVAVDLAARTVYWTDPQAGHILSSAFSGAPVEVLISGLDSPFGLALEGGMLYWTAKDRIQRAVVGTGAVDDVVTGLSDPVGITVDPASGMIYWTEMLGQRIRRATLDGDLISSVVTGLDSPYGIAFAGAKLYWSDWRLGKIQVADQEVWAPSDLVTGLASPVGVAVDTARGRLYWTDASGVGFVSLDGDILGNLAVLPGNPGGIGLAEMPATVPLGRDEEVWVDFNAGTVQTGTYLLPYLSILNALNGVANGGTIKIVAGSSSTASTISTPVRLEAWMGTVRIGGN